VSWSLRIACLAAACVIAVCSGCSIIASNGPTLNQRCDRTLPALDLAAAITATGLAIAFDSESGKAVGAGVLFGLSSATGFAKTSKCRARNALPPPPTDKFLGSRRWSTTFAVKATEGPMVALERAYQRAALVCEGFGFSSLRSTPLEPWRPRRMTLVYKCH